MSSDSSRYVFLIEQLVVMLQDPPYWAAAGFLRAGSVWTWCLRDSIPRIQNSKLTGQAKAFALTHVSDNLEEEKSHGLMLQ